MESKNKLGLNLILVLNILILLLPSVLMPLALAHDLGQQAQPNLTNSPEGPDYLVDQPTTGTSSVEIKNVYFESLKNRKRPENVIDERLQGVLAESESEDIIEIIIQFTTWDDEANSILLIENNFEIIHEFSGLPAVYARGSKEAILNLVTSERIFWVEYNEPIELHMEKSLGVINATKTWNTIVTDEHGRQQEPIDGTGVTVVVLDTGIDAGHPDLDYKEKTISNLKSDFGFGPWVEMENSDTSYGHGTHCAGTVAGNGDASGGARRGVAPGAKLIGLSIGDFGVNLANALGGYEWIYDNTKPYTGDPNDYNIRVVSNSWGPAADKYDPNDAISQYIELCTVEKNVVSVFAAGNSGEDDHDGHKVETNPYGTTPMSICVAATERDGKGMAEFTSRGEAGLNETWPDVAAPGVRIWSAAARRTYISVMKNLQDWSDLDPYYFAISGTSMATPHVAGSVALLFQACPSLKLSAQHDDFSDLDNETYSELEGGWWNSPQTLVHEAELILEASTSYIEPAGDNGVPKNHTVGWTENKSDFAQGYGLINVERAVAIALTLNELRTRDFNNDGQPDYPNASVHDAIKQYTRILERKLEPAKSDKLISQWHGDWTRFTNQTTWPNQMLSTDQSHFIYIPNTANKLILDLLYEPIQTTDELISVARIRLVIDYDGDGNPDWPTSSTYSDKHSELDLNSGGFGSNRGKLWNFNIEGVGFGLPGAPSGNLIGESYYEITVEYIVDLRIIFETPTDEIINMNNSFDINNPKIGNLKVGGPTSNYQSGELNIYQSYFNLDNVHPPKVSKIKEKVEQAETPWYVWLLLGLAFLVLVVLFYRKYQRESKK
ncbi:S8 family serine peptidase [[Eubacterium] cellulosolvens]